MALPALLGAGARAVGGSMVKAGGRAAAGKILGRGRKKQPGRLVPSGGEQGGVGRSGAIVPKTKMVSAKEIKSLQTGDTVSPGKDPLKSIYSNVILIEKILKGNNIADRDALKEQKKNDKKADKAAQEKKLETKPPKIDKKKGEVMKLPQTGVFGWIKNFIGNILMGYFAVRLIKYLPQILELLKGLGRVVEFVTDVGMFLVDGIASFINFAYNVYDGTRNIFKSVGLEGAFDGIMKAVEVAITVLTFALGAKSLGGFGGGKGGTAKTPKTRVRTKPQEAFQAGRPKRMQPPGTTSQGAASRYARRYGEGAAKRRFGQAAGKKAAQQAAGKLGVKGAARVLGPLVKRIPVIGGLIEFVLSVVSGDSVGKAAFRAVGSGLGTWIGGALGSLIPVPFVGTAIGAFVGGAGGSELAGAMYDAFFGGKEKQPEPEEPEAKQSGGEVGRGFQEETITQQKKSIRKKPSFTKIKPPLGGKIKTGEKSENAWWDFLGWGGTGGQDVMMNLGPGGQMLANKVVNLGNSFGEYPYFGPILSLAAKVILGETPSEEEYKNVGYGLNMLVGDGVQKGKVGEGIRGYEDGGMISDYYAMAGIDVGRWATDTFKKELSTTLNKTFDVVAGSTAGPGTAAGERDPATGEMTPGTQTGTSPGTASGAIAASDLYTKIGANAEQWDIFRNSVALIESGGDYSVPGGSGMHYDGRYQMGAAAKTDGSRYAGVPDPGHSDDPNAQVRAAYRANKELQETIFTGFTLANHTYLMGNETYKNSSIERKLEILGYAHNQGMGGAENWMTTGVVGADGFGTKGTKYTDLIAANFRAKKSGEELELADNAISVPSLPDEPGSADTTGGGDISVSGSGIVNIGKDLISKGFSVAEHPDFTKTPTASGGAYTPGKGTVSRVHKGAGHYDGRAIDVTDWRGSLEDSKARYRSVLTSLQDNPAIKMLIHDSWGAMYGGPGTKQGPGAHSHSEHMHIEVKDKGGFIGKGLFANLGGKEFVTDADSTAALGQVAPGLQLALNQARDAKGVESALQQYASYEQGAQQTVMVQDPPQQMPEESPQSSGGGMMAMSGGSSHDPFEFLDFQG